MSFTSSWRPSLFALYFQWILLCQVVADVATSEETVKPKCGLYLAPSSIPGAGLGMYAGDRIYREKDTVTLGDVVIPISEYDWNNEGGDFEGDSFLWDEYTWNSYVFTDMEEEGEDGDLIMVASPGVGAAANSYLSLVNIEDTYTKTSRPVPEDSPGVGANTLFWGREFFATEEIPAGGEIFVDYGANYFKSRKYTYGYLPLPQTFEVTDVILRKYQKVKEKVNSKNQKKLDDSFWGEYYDIVTSFGPIWKKSRILNGLPNDEDIIDTLMEEGGSSRKDFNKSIRELSWLEQNGQCMDNIKPGNSTIPHAGRGAFANRFIPKGGLVAPAPLIHIGDYNAFKVYPPTDLEHMRGKVGPDLNAPFRFQLLLNYCFGHGDSTLLLCPYGLLTALINHSPTEPNTRIQWSKDMRHPNWREEDIYTWIDEYHTGLQIDFVALRDIEEDEEIVIDYGKEWEEAWQQHAKDFVPRKDYIPAFELNEMEDIDYWVYSEERDYPAASVQLWCHGWYINNRLDDNAEDQECRILKNLGNDRYRVQLIYTDYNDGDRYVTIEEGRILWDVPSDIFYFMDLPYTRDHYNLNSFRHRMMIPDDMFPDMWKNVGRPKPEAPSEAEDPLPIDK